MSRGILLLLLENSFGDVADAMNLRPVDLRLGFGFVPHTAARTAAALQNMRADTLGFVHFDGTGVRFLFGHANCGQSFQDFPALHLQLTR
jgi:hypothetical protein